MRVFGVTLVGVSTTTGVKLLFTVELSLRFLVPHRSVREVKDRISRDILAAPDRAGISIASATYDVVVRPVAVDEQAPPDHD